MNTARLNFTRLNTSVLNASLLNSSLMGGRGKGSSSRPSGLIAQYKPYLNSNDSPTRETLKDYSGHGNDVVLYNFAFAGMSGYGGYQQYSSLWSVNHADANEIVNDYTLKIIKQDGGSANFFSQTKRNPSINCKIKVSGLPLDSNYIIIQYYNSDLSSVDYFKIHNGINNVSLTPSDETQDSIYIYCPVQIGIVKDQPLNVLIEFLPNYPGALVSDGVDDYGSITKPFGNVGTVIFMLDEIKWDDKRFLHNISVDEDGNRLYCWKSNGQVASGLPPTETDIDNYFIIFTRKSQYVGSGWILFGSSASSTISVALYALEIYDRDLTEEEIETVKQRMIKEYEKATGNVMEGVILLEDGTDLLLEDGTSLLME